MVQPAEQKTGKTWRAVADGLNGVEFGVFEQCQKANEKQPAVSRLSFASLVCIVRMPKRYAVQAVVCQSAVPGERHNATLP